MGPAIVDLIISCLQDWVIGTTTDTEHDLDKSFGESFPKSLDITCFYFCRTGEIGLDNPLPLE